MKVFCGLFSKATAFVLPVCRCINSKSNPFALHGNLPGVGGVGVYCGACLCLEVASLTVDGQEGKGAVQMIVPMLYLKMMKDKSVYSFTDKFIVGYSFN